MAALMTETEVLQSLTASFVPGTLHGGIARWIAYAVKPGDFLSAVLVNDLVKAVAHGDRRHIAALKDIVDWFHEHAPAACCFREDVFESWPKHFPVPPAVEPE